MNKNVKYVQQKRVAPLLNDMVCHLVTTFPEDPIEGLIHYLEKRFPDAAESAAQKTGIPVGQMTASPPGEDPNGKKQRTEDGTLIPTPPPTEEGHASRRVPPIADTTAPVSKKLGGSAQSSIPNTPREGMERPSVSQGSMMGSMFSGTFGPNSAMFGKEVNQIIDELRENEELMVAAVGKNRAALSSGAAGYEADRSAALRAEGFSQEFLDTLGTVESNYRSGQVALNSAYFGSDSREQTAQELLQRISENEAAFAQLLTKASKSSHAKKEREQIAEAIEKSDEMQQLLHDMSVTGQQCQSAVYDTLYRKALGSVARESDPNVLLEMIEKNEAAFLDSISAARKASKGLVDRTLLTTAEKRGVEILSTLEEMKLNIRDMEQLNQANADSAGALGGETAAHAQRVVHELVTNEEVFLEQLLAAVSQEKDVTIRRTLRDAAFASEDALTSLREIESTGADVELSFAALYGSLSPEELTTLRALRMIEEINTENERMRSKVGMSLQLQAELHAQAAVRRAEDDIGGRTASPGVQRGNSPIPLDPATTGLIDNYADVEAVEKILAGQAELQELLATAQERELQIEQALHRGNHGLQAAAQDNTRQMTSVVAQLKAQHEEEEAAAGRVSMMGRTSVTGKRAASSRLMGQTTGSPVVTLVEMLMSSVDLVSTALEHELDVTQRAVLTHLQIRTRKTCLVAQLHGGSEQTSAQAKKLFADCDQLTREIVAFYGTLKPEHKGEVVALKQQTELILGVQAFCDTGIVAEAVLAE